MAEPQEQIIAAQAAEIERLNKRVAELANRCLDVRDQVNKYHKSKLQSNLDELDRLVGECNKPDLIHDLEKIRDDLHADEVRKWREAFDRECESRRQVIAELERLRAERDELRGLLFESHRYVVAFAVESENESIEEIDCDDVDDPPRDFGFVKEARALAKRVSELASRPVVERTTPCTK